MANTMDKNIVMKDKKEAAYISSLNSPVKGMIKNQDMLVNGIKYRVYYTITDADMIYGILVPVSTIEQPVVRYAILNVAMAAVLALVLLVVLNLVLGTTLNQVRKLTDAGNKIADGNIDVEIPALKTGDEIEDLSGTMTMLVGALKFLKKENEEKQKPGKKK
jgi:HAMP domain-containing protein